MSATATSADLTARFAPSLKHLADELVHVGDGRVYVASAGPQNATDDQTPHLFLDFAVDHPGYDSAHYWVIVRVTSTAATFTVLYRDDPTQTHRWDSDSTLTIPQLFAYIGQLPRPFTSFGSA